MSCSEELAAERTRSNLDLAVQLRYTRRLHTLRRARHMECKAEHRLGETWRRAARLRGTTESADY